jgi:hypothetical protein
LSAETLKPRNIIIARQDSFNQTDKEQYQLLGEAPVKAGRSSYRLAEKSGLVKVLLKEKHNRGNV